MLATARKQDLDDTVAIHPTSAEGSSKISWLQSAVSDRNLYKRIGYAPLEHQYINEDMVLSDVFDVLATSCTWRLRSAPRKYSHVHIVFHRGQIQTDFKRGVCHPRYRGKEIQEWMLDV